MEKRGTGITYVKVIVNLLIMALTILCCFLVLPRIIVYFYAVFYWLDHFPDRQSDREVF